MVKTYAISKYLDDSDRVTLTVKGERTMMPEIDLFCVDPRGGDDLEINLTYYEAERLRSVLDEIFHDNMKVRWHFESEDDLS